MPTHIWIFYASILNYSLTMTSAHLWLASTDRHDTLKNDFVKQSIATDWLRIWFVQAINQFWTELWIPPFVLCLAIGNHKICQWNRLISLRIPKSIFQSEVVSKLNLIWSINIWILLNAFELFRQTQVETVAQMKSPVTFKMYHKIMLHMMIIAERARRYAGKKTLIKREIVFFLIELSTRIQNEMMRIGIKWFSYMWLQWRENEHQCECKYNEFNWTVKCEMNKTSNYLDKKYVVYMGYE